MSTAVDPEAGGVSLGGTGNVSFLSTSSSSSSENDDVGDDRPRHNEEQDDNQGSSVIGAIFNFTNSIIGAGAIGLGGAIAVSGGAVSIFLILFFGYLTKLSLDLVIRLSIKQERQQEDDSTQQQQSQHHGTTCTYEDLASKGLGHAGRSLVSACKLAYSFGCLVAYIVVLKDNFGPALKNIIYRPPVDGGGDEPDTWVYAILSANAYFTWIVSSTLILPLCMLRNMTPLAKFSVVSVVSMAAIVVIVIYIYFKHPEIRTPDADATFYENWIEIRPGVFESLGTFVFTFVSQHTVHLVFGSLKPRLRTLSNWKIVSSAALTAATTVSLTVGVVLYITFWQHTKSDIFEIYPQTLLIDLAKLLLCITMILTFPLPFFTCRELIIVTFIHPLCIITSTTSNNNQEENGRSTGDATTDDNDLCEPLLPNGSSDVTNNNDEGGGCDDEVGQQYDELLNESRNGGGGGAVISDSVSVVSELSRMIVHTATPKNWLLPDDDRQLQLVGHMTLTGKLWVVATGFAIAAPNLGDVLDLVGCATGTIIAFILPAILAFRLEGFSLLALILLVVGGIVGTVGTYYSIDKLISDF